MKQAALGFLAMLCLTAPLAAQKPYEAVIAGPHGGCAFEPFISTVDWIGPSGVIAESKGRTVAAAPGGRVFAADRSDDADAFEIVEIGLGGFRRRVSQTIPLGPRDPDALVVDVSGNMYLLASENIYALDAAGALRATVSLGTPGTSMDLAADQCTMFIAADPGVRRFNVCTGTPLPDFGPVAPGHLVVRLLPDGGVLLARQDAIDRYTPGGVLTRTYAVSGSPIALALANGGNSVWLARSCAFDLRELDLGSGAATTIAPIGNANPNSIVPYTGWSAALGSFHNAGVPTASQLMLLALGFLLASFALFRMR